jgi:hypothetical protein
MYWPLIEHVDIVISGRRFYALKIGFQSTGPVKSASRGQCGQFRDEITMNKT